MTTADDWERYRATGDRCARNRLIVEYSPLVRRVAARMAAGLPTGVDRDDLVGYGTFGLIGAIERFDPGRGTRFESYAATRIRGAIIDELRLADWVPRTVRARATSVARARSALATRLGGEATDAEVATEMRTTEGKVRSAIPLRLVSLDSGVSRAVGDTIPDAQPGPEALFEAKEAGQSLVGAIGHLSEKERTVVALYYYEGLTLVEIGATLGVTASRVCQIHVKALRRLRWRMAVPA